MNVILALIISAFATFAPASQPATIALPPALTVCHEEDPCWDAKTMGNGQADTLKQDAWKSFEHTNIHAPEDSPNLMLSYTETVSGVPANLPQGYFTIKSDSIPNAYHVFKWDILQDV